MMGPYEFKGTERFEVQGRLGSGTSGEVYRVFDRKLKTIVALKTLHKSDPASIYRFKREFRALADVNHPNLVQLYELLSDGDRWFFTMELVDGLDFIDYTRSQPGVEMFDTARFYSLPTPTAPADPERLRMALRQLAEGLCALHTAGKLHCDLKPSNIRVEPDGRVVLLDFGLVKERFSSSQLYETMDGDISGTPAYMSPEQAAGRKVTPASDWYSTGVILYEALTGNIPFKGGFLKILTDKQSLDPPPPRGLIPEVPEDLSDLCVELLARDPEKRPSAERVLRLLGGAPSRHTAQTTSSTATSERFVGRKKHLAELVAAFDRTRQGKTVLFFVHGSSGMGKSALVQRFMHQLQHEREGVVLLTGRCYERESVPYKAFDALIDALSRYLRQLPNHEVEVLMPTNVLALARLFPALRRVQAVAGAQRRVLEIPDSRELRRRAFAALRELLARLSDRRPVVLYVDDLHWGDLDSAALLTELLRPPDPPAVLWIACYRSEERETSALLQALDAASLATVNIDLQETEVQELSADEARELALELLGERTESVQALAATIAHESGGNPFFIDELVRYSKAEAGFDQLGQRTLPAEVERALNQRMSLERLISARLDRLPPEARRLLEVVAVAGRPIDLEAARQAAELGSETQAVIAILRAASLSRLRGSREREEIETYNDRIRSAVLKRLDDVALKQLHRRLAVALEAGGSTDPEALAIHFFYAGDRERAADFAVDAANQASDALAFDRAARLYRIALDLEIHEPEVQRGLRIKLGDALTNAGRGAEAALAYLQAAEGAKAAQALELRRRAAEQQMISGHIDAGLATIRTVLQSIGMKFPPTPRRALFSIVFQLLQLKWRGLSFKERDSTQISAQKLIEIDTCWSVSIGLGAVDTIRGMSFGKRHLLLALRAGEPYRVARALAIESGYSGTGGTKAQQRTAHLVREAMALAERVNHPHALGLANVTAGIAAYLEGRFKKAFELIDRGEQMLREGCTGVTWELDTAIAYQLRALLFIGDLREIRKRLPDYLKDVLERGDLYAEVNLRSRVVWVTHLAADRPDRAQAELEAVLERWTQRGFHIQHYWLLTGQVETALYRGDALSAWQILATTWPRIEKSLLLRIQLTRTEGRHLLCRGALAAAAAQGTASPAGQALISRVIQEVRVIEREKISWAEPLTQLIRAALLTLEGDRKAAAELLAAAAAGFDAADMLLYAAVSRLRRGQLLSDTGKRLVAEAEAWITAQGVQDSAKFANVLAPGFGE